MTNKSSSSPQSAFPNELPTPLRAVIIGSSGSGKTTFSEALAQSCNVPHIELDSLYWGTDWTPVPLEQFQERALSAIQADGWVCDGNYPVLQHELLRGANLVVWLNLPFWVVFARVLLRSLQRIYSRRVLYSGNRETFRRTFLSRHSILVWVVTSYLRRKRRYRTLFEMRPVAGAAFVELRSPQEVHEFLCKFCYQ